MSALRRPAVVVLLLAVGIAGLLVPAAPTGASPPTRYLTGAADAMLAEDGSGWLIQDQAYAGFDVQLVHRAADGSKTLHGRVWSRDDLDGADPRCSTLAIGGTPTEPYLLAGAHLCPVAADGSRAPVAVPPGTSAEQMVVDTAGRPWFSGSGATALGRVDATGLTAVALPGSGTVTALGIGPDGRVRAARGGRAFAVADDGTASPVAGLTADVAGLATGPDGQLWAWTGCPAPCAKRLVRVGPDGVVTTVLDGGPAAAPTLVAAGGRLWFGAGDVLMGVDPAGGVRRIPLGLLSGGIPDMPEDDRVDVVTAYGSTLVGTTGSDLWTFDARPEVAVTLTATVAADPTPGGGWIVAVDARGADGEPVAGTADVYRSYTSVGTAGPYGFGRAVSAPFTTTATTIAVPPLGRNLCPAQFLTTDRPGVVTVRTAAGGGATAGLAEGGPDRRALAATRAAFTAVLGRDADTAALTFWAGRWRAPADSPAVAAGLVASREAEVRIVRAVYGHTLGRAPDAAGLEFWRDQLRRTGRLRVTAAVVGSGEAYTRAGATPARWVDGAHRQLLGRAPTAAESRAAVARLAAGASRATVATELMRAPSGVAARVARTATELGATAEVVPADTASFTSDEALRRTLAARAISTGSCTDRS